MPSALIAMDLACALILASAYRSVSSLEVKVAASGSFLSAGLQYSMFPAHSWFAEAMGDRVKTYSLDAGLWSVSIAGMKDRSSSEMQDSSFKPCAPMQDRSQVCSHHNLPSLQPLLGGVYGATPRSSKEMTASCCGT